MTAKRIIFGLCAMAVGISVNACGTTTTITTTASPPASTATTQQASSAQIASIDSPITLSGNGGEKMQVTVLAVQDPLTVNPAADTADPGTRFVSVKIRLTDVGSTAYGDSPSNGAVLLDNADQQAKSTIVSGGPAGNGFAPQANIPPGGTEVGWIPFEINQGNQPAKFQFTLNSGFADQIGQWALATKSTSMPATTATTTATATATQTTTSTATTTGFAPYTTVDPKSAEHVIETNIQKFGSIQAKSVSCPSGVEKVEGATLVCQVTLVDTSPGAQASGTITLHLINGGQEATFSARTSR